MRRIGFVCVFLTGELFDLSAQQPFVCDGRFFVTMVNFSGSRFVVVEIDPITDLVEFNTIRTDLGVIINGIAYRPEENLIYAVHPSEHFLYRIDATGDVETLAELPLTPNYFYLGADITPDGRFFILVGSEDIEGIPLDQELVLVDLEDPAYPVTHRVMSGEPVNMLDIAFDPTDNQLYGFDSFGDRLVKVGLDGAVETPFESSDLLENAGSLFFDIFGNLYAYGSPAGTTLQNTLYAVDKRDGTFRILTTGETARATDGCSCPHSVEVQKSVSPRRTIPCAEVEYVFAISNQSRRAQEGIDFEDHLPSGFTITELRSNPFGGNLVSGVGTSSLQITNMTIPPGIDSIVIAVEVGDVPGGVYKNQAQLFGLPVGLGEFRISDDPVTLQRQDSTELLVATLDFDTLERHELFCVGEPLSLDASQYGVTFAWDDGSMSATLEVQGQGTYSVQAMSPCDTAFIIYFVEESSVSVSLSAEQLDIRIGDTVRIFSDASHTGSYLEYLWDDPLGNSLGCVTCPSPIAYPLDDVTYTLTVTDEVGCQDVASITLRVDRSYKIYAANIFSPNGDQINDLFYLQGKGISELAEWSIFDRYGSTVHSISNGQLNDPSLGWNGHIGSRQALPGVYVWVAELRFFDGSRTFISGDVTLLR